MHSIPRSVKIELDEDEIRRLIEAIDQLVQFADFRPSGLRIDCPGRKRVPPEQCTVTCFPPINQSVRISEQA
jgi:hypothetical protein